jgi:uncharacterized protein (TIGR02391 family)
MAHISTFDSSHLEAVCRILANTENGLTGQEIERLLYEVNVADINPEMTKWKRLYNALVNKQNQVSAGNHLILFINAAMKPARHLHKSERFDWLRDNLNVALSLCGYNVNANGQVIKSSIAFTLATAKARAEKLKTKLESRGTHSEVFKYCKVELLEDNYFHAVLEASKGLAERIREMSGLGSDGAQLANTALSVNAPLIRINNLKTETELSEQKGLANLLVGLFGAVRNPVAHSPKIVWNMPEQDAVDIFALISFIHRKLDNAQTTSNKH